MMYNCIQVNKQTENIKMNIKQALDTYASTKEKRISRKYNGDAEAFKKRMFQGCMEMSSFGKSWEKEGIKRIYFNDFNLFYDYETQAIEKIFPGEEMDYDSFEQDIVKIILSD